jgi:hypothetical protein
MSEIFKVPVYGFNNGKKIQIDSVEAQNLIVQGQPIIDPTTNAPYVVPLGYNLEKTIMDFKNQLADKLLAYKTGGAADLQRNFNGKNFGGFVPAFTLIASFDFGIACRATNTAITTCEAAGGMLNLINRATNSKINTTGFLLNNPSNVIHMENANNYYNQYYHNPKNTYPAIIQDKVPELGNDELMNWYEKNKDTLKNMHMMYLYYPEDNQIFKNVLLKALQLTPEMIQLSPLERLEAINLAYQKQDKDVQFLPTAEMLQQKPIRLTPQGLDADKLAEAQAESALRSNQNLGRSV